MTRNASSRRSSRSDTPQAARRSGSQQDTTPAAQKWIGTRPERCQICHDPLRSSFVDGKTKWGPWALMCGTCHRSFGCGLGLGKGQIYDLETLFEVEG